MAGRPGRSGRRPLPTSVKMARGTYRNDRDGKGVEIDTPADGLDWPADERWLDVVQEEHVRLVALLSEHNVLSEADHLAWYAGMGAANRLMKLEDQLTNVDFLAKGEDGGAQYMHPGYTMLKMFQTTFQKFCQEFGLTPSSRAALKFDFSAKQEDDLENALTDNEGQDGFRETAGALPMDEPPAHSGHS